MVVVGRFGGREGTRSSVTKRKDSDSSRLWVDEAAMLWFELQSKVFHAPIPDKQTLEGSRTILYPQLVCMNLSAMYQISQSIRTAYNFSFYRFLFTCLCSQPFARTVHLLDAHRKDETGPIHLTSK